MPRPRPARACAAPGCGQPIPAPRVMCRRHWAMLPDALRAAIANCVRAGRKADLAANLRKAERLLEEEDTGADRIAADRPIPAPSPLDVAAVIGPMMFL